MIRIVGIDLDSKKIAAVLFVDGEFNQLLFFQSKNKNTDERLFELYKYFESMVIKHLKPDKVFIEDSIYVANFKTSKALSESIGNVKLLCRLNQIPFELVSNKTWKKEIIGNGNASKADIKKFVLEQKPDLIDEPQDIFDSFCVAKFGVRNELNRQTFV